MKFSFRFKFGSKNVLTLLRNLSVTLKSGVALSKGLSLFEEGAKSSRKSVISHLRKAVESGNNLSTAMESSPYTFPPLAINLVRTGELGGTLQESLSEIVRNLRKSLVLKRKVRSAMMYPTFVFVAIVGLGLSVGIFVLPELIPLFESLDVELPWTTQALLKAAAYFEVHGLITGIAMLLSVAAAWIITRFECAKLPLHTVLLRIPYIGDVQRKTAIAQMSVALGSLLKSGIPIDEAIPAAAHAIENRVFRKALLAALPVVQRGQTFTKGLARTKIFPRMAVALMEIAEETGTMTESLDYLAEYYEDEVDYAVKTLTTALEPILLIFIGIIVGGTVLAIITPIYDVTGNIR